MDAPLVARLAAETETDHKKSGVVEAILVQKGHKLAANTVVAIIVEDDAEEGEAKEP